MARAAPRTAIVAALIALLPGFVPAHGTARAGCTAFPYVSVLAAGPSGSLLAGTRDGHIYRSAIGVLCWTDLASFPGGVEIGTLVAPPGQPHTILAGGSWLASPSPASQTLYRSEDDGRTWASATTGLARTAILPVSIATSPRGTLVLSFVCPQDYQATEKNRRCLQGLARSVDGGRSWHPVGPPILETRNVIALPDGTFLALLAPRSKSVLPSTTYRGPGSLYRSSDDGQTWQPVSVLSGTEDRNALSHLAGISAFFAAPWRPADLFIGVDLTYFTAVVYRSRDGGGHWSMAWAARKAGVTSALAEPAVISFAALTRTHTVLFTDFGNIYRSVDEGATWTRARIAPAPDATDRLQFWNLLVAQGSATAYAGAATGIYRSDDDGQTWNELP